jgi:hypothetical protein
MRRSGEGVLKPILYHGQRSRCIGSVDCTRRGQVRALLAHARFHLLVGSDGRVRQDICIYVSCLHQVTAGFFKT